MHRPRRMRVHPAVIEARRIAFEHRNTEIYLLSGILSKKDLAKRYSLTEMRVSQIIAQYKKKLNAQETIPNNS